MNDVRKWVVERPLSELTISWYDRDGTQVEFGKQSAGYMFEVKGEGINFLEVRRIEFPPFDYGINDEEMMVKVHCGSFMYIDETFEESEKRMIDKENEDENR